MYLQGSQGVPEAPGIHYGKPLDISLYSDRGASSCPIEDLLKAGAGIGYPVVLSQSRHQISPFRRAVYQLGMYTMYMPNWYL